MIASIKHWLALRAIKRERELKQATCAHSWQYAGHEYEYFNAGSSVESSKYYIYECPQCGAVRHKY